MTLYKPDKRTVWTWFPLALGAAPLPAAVSLWLWQWQGVPRQIVLIFTALWGGALLLTVAVYIPLRCRHMAYALTEDRLVLHSGVLFRSGHTMPIAGVCHVTMLQGPLERRFGTAFLLVQGAGGILLMEGMPAELASRWQQRLLAP